MKLRHIPASDRFSYENEWLRAKWHFSFGHYFDADNVGFGALKVFNDDLVAPSSGFDSHSHKEMEIVTIVLAGEIEHRDSTGAHRTLRAGEVQRMTAGTGISHSERNPRTNEATRMLQIWITPDVERLPPEHVQKRFSVEPRRGRLQRIISKHPTGEELSIHQDADFYHTLLDPGDRVVFTPAAGRRQYVYAIRGAARVGEQRLGAGDQARIEEATEIVLTSDGGATKVLLIDLA